MRAVAVVDALTFNFGRPTTRVSILYLRPRQEHTYAVRSRRPRWIARIGDGDGFSDAWLRKNHVMYDGLTVDVVQSFVGDLCDSNSVGKVLH